MSSERNQIIPLQWLQQCIFISPSLRPSAHTEIRIKPDTKIFLRGVSVAAQRARGRMARMLALHCLEHARRRVAGKAEIDCKFMQAHWAERQFAGSIVECLIRQCTVAP